MRILKIPPEQLSSDTLQAVVEAFICREGTDYGLHESTLQSKVTEVLEQLKQGHVVLVFDTAVEECNLMTHEQYGVLMAQENTE